MSGLGLPLLFGGATGAFNVPVESLPRPPDRVFGPANWVVRQVPDFLRRDHPRLIEFLEAYFEWLETFGGPFYAIDKLADLADVDRTLDSFLVSFRKTYLDGFPEELAVSEAGEPLDIRSLIKNATAYYRRKGSEKGFQLLFRILMDLSLEVVYPKNQVLRSSDGKWIQENSLRLTTRNGVENFEMIQRTLKQYDRVTKELTAYGTVDRVLQFSIEQYDVTEVYLKDIFGTFTTNSDVSCLVESGATLSESVFSIIDSFTVEEAGKGYKVGDKVTFGNGTVGFGGRGEIVSTSPKGAIKTIRPIDFGVNYFRGESVTINSNSGDGTARVTIVPGALCRYPGYWNNNDGKISSNRHLFDGDYFQDFSYALKSEAALDRYKTAVLRLAHPAGMKMFGLVSFLREMNSLTTHHSEEQAFEIPLVGHYTPYRLGTTADIRSLYPSGFNPSSTAADHNTQRVKVSFGTTLGGSSLTVAHGFTQTIGAGLVKGNIIDFALYPDGPTGSTTGIVYVRNQGTGNGFAVSASLTLGGITFSNGLTGTVVEVWSGEGFVIEGGSTAHNPQGLPMGAHGTDGYTAAAALGLTVWTIYVHPNTRGIVNLDGGTSGSTGAGLSFGSIQLAKFFHMPIGYHYHSNPGTGPYMGSTGPYNEYSTVLGGGLTSPNGI